ncbi:MAG TPA: ATP-binding cassette domain-containing protein [Alcanivorax sp.]|nr:ATP-binding cassette domain-containing protein [Alcanivorax sp.]
MSKYLDISKISIDFPTPEGPFRALDALSLRIRKGEFVSLIGHSGCGKSTVLNILAGLLQATEGGAALEGKAVNEPGPDQAVVFQNHSLLPWLTAFENVQLAVRQVFRDSMSKTEMRDWIEQNLKLVHMEHAMHKRPRNRVTLAENSDYNPFRQRVLSFLYEKQRKVVEIPREPTVTEKSPESARGKVAGLVDRLGRRA